MKVFLVILDKETDRTHSHSQFFGFMQFLSNLFHFCLFCNENFLQLTQKDLLALLLLCISNSIYVMFCLYCILQKLATVGVSSAVVSISQTPTVTYVPATSARVINTTPVPGNRGSLISPSTVTTLN